MKTLTNSEASALLSQTFDVEDLQPFHPQLSQLGIKRVVAVVLHEGSTPEIGLADHADSDDIEFLPAERLILRAASMSQLDGAGDNHNNDFITSDRVDAKPTFFPATA